MSAPFLVRIIATALVVPWFVVLAGRLRGAREFVPFAVAFYLLVGSDVANLLEKLFALEVMDAVQHALFAATGIAAAVGAIMVRRAVLERRVAG